MSGIAGSVRFDDGPADTALVRRMAQSMQHRAPDGTSYASANGAALAQLTLKTTSESASETIQDADRALTLVMDGRIDNWEELRGRLSDAGTVFRTRSDAELVLAAFAKWGSACLCHIDGDFAFVIWDDRARRAFCARDRMGQKPFFYRWNGTRLVFASELRPVLDAMGGSPGLNDGVVAEILDNRWISREETLWQGLLRLAPGCSMTVDRNGPKTTQYWSPEDIPLLQYKSDTEYQEHYRNVFFDVVRRVSRSDAPVGCDVSGGLDSSAVFATAHELTKTNQLPAPDIHGYTLLFEAGTDAYELDYARAVGTHTGRVIAEVPPTRAPLTWYRQETLRLGTIASLPNVLMHDGTYRALRASGGRAYLNGVGGDQWLAFGDNALAEALQLGDWPRVWRTLSRDAHDFGALTTGWRALRHGAYPLLPDALRSFARDHAPIRPEGHEPETWLSDRLQDVLMERRHQAARDWRKRTKGLRIGLRQRLLAVESAYLQFASELIEAMGQRAGVEIRSPLLNRTFVEFCLSLPMAQLRRGTTDRYVHRRALSEVLPDAVVNRDDKAEFSVATAPVRDALVAMKPPDKPGWLRPSRFQDVQTCALDPSQARYSWPEGMLLCFYVLNALDAGGYERETALA